MVTLRKSDPLWILIAMWLWSTAAAGDTLPIPTQALKQNGYQYTLAMPCNWDKTMGEVKVNAVYASPSTYEDVRSYTIFNRDSIVHVPLTPISMSMVEANPNQLHIIFNSDMPDTLPPDKYLYHLEVEFETTNTRCKQGFGFGSMTR